MRKLIPVVFLTAVFTAPVMAQEFKIETPKIKNTPVEAKKDGKKVKLEVDEKKQVRVGSWKVKKLKVSSTAEPRDYHEDISEQWDTNISLERKVADGNLSVEGRLESDSRGLVAVEHTTGSSDAGLIATERGAGVYAGFKRGNKGGWMVYSPEEVSMAYSVSNSSFSTRGFVSMVGDARMMATRFSAFNTGGYNLDWGHQISRRMLETSSSSMLNGVATRGGSGTLNGGFVFYEDGVRRWSRVQLESGLNITKKVYASAGISGDPLNDSVPSATIGLSVKELFPGMGFAFGADFLRRESYRAHFEYKPNEGKLSLSADAHYNLSGLRGSLGVVYRLN